MIKQNELKKKAVDYLQNPQIDECSCEDEKIAFYLEDTEEETATQTYICPYCYEVTKVTRKRGTRFVCPHCHSEPEVEIELDYNGTYRIYRRDVADIIDFNTTEKYLILAEICLDVEVSVPEIERGVAHDINLRKAMKEFSCQISKSKGCTYVMANGLTSPSHGRIDGVKQVILSGRKEDGSSVFTMRTCYWLPSYDLVWLNSEMYKRFIDGNACKKLNIESMCSLKSISKAFSSKDSLPAAKSEAEQKQEAIKAAADKIYMATENHDIEEFVKSKASISTAFELNTTDKGTEYVIYCCGKRHVVFPNESGHICCPVCGARKEISSYAPTYGSVIDTLLAEDGNIVVNEYEYSIDIPEDITDKSQIPVAKDLRKCSVTVLTPKGSIQYYEHYERDGSCKFSRNNHHPDKFRGKFALSLGRKKRFIMNLERGEDILDIVNQSNFKTYGVEYFAVFWDKDEKNNDAGEKIGALLEHIVNVTKIPICEFLAKQELWKIYNRFAYSMRMKDISSICKIKATSIREAFGLSKKQAKILNREKLSLDQLLCMKKIMALDENAEWDDIKWVFDNYTMNSSGDNDILRCMEKSQTRLKDVKAYLLSCLYNQAITLSESPQLWCDYISMMDKLKFSAAQIKKELHPSSLKKAHDVLNFATINIFDKEKAKIFDDNIEECKRFEYSFEDYFIKAPDSAEELVQEGIALNHSVAQHIEYVADGEEFILFIRAKAAPDVPFYTVELLKNKSIVQIRGNSNKPVKEEVVLNFIQKWAKFKKLSIVSM